MPLNLLAEEISMNDRLFWGTFVLILGLVIVFVGVILIAVILRLISKVMGLKGESKSVNTIPASGGATAVKPSDGNDVPAEVKAAIVAAITAYYFNSPNSKCEFRVRKIKRI